MKIGTSRNQKYENAYMKSLVLMSSIRIERTHRLRSKNSPRPTIVRFSHYKAREKMLKAYRENRKMQNNKNVQGVMADPSIRADDQDNIWQLI